MKTHYWFIPFICMMFISCTKPNYYAPDKIKYVDSQKTYDSLKAELLSFSVLAPYQISFIDSLLIIMTKNPSEFITIVNTRNDSLIANICQEGRGPNEYMVPHSLKQYYTNESGDRLLYVTDNFIMVKALNITRSIRENESICEKPIQINTMLMEPLFLSQEAKFMKQNVSYDDPRDNIFYPPKYIFKSNSSTKEYNIYPDIVKNISFPALPLSLYDAMLQVKPDLTKIVDVMGFIDNMNIIELSSETCIGIMEQNSYSFEDLTYLSMDKLLKTIKYCVLDVSVTDEYILILYDGRSIDAAENHTEELKPSIKIFNWEGDFIQGYQLSEPLRGITYDENRKYIYGFDMEENFYRYKLPTN